MEDHEMRRILEDMETNIAALSKDTTSVSAVSALAALRAGRDQLQAMTVGPARQTRACPRCSKLGMRDATRCGFCWLKLTPAAASVAAKAEQAR